MNTARYIRRIAVAGMAMAFVGIANANLIISEVDLIGNKVELVNIGASSVDTTTWWWCNRVNGSPFYDTVASSSTIDAGLSTATSFNVGAGEILVLDISAGFLPNGNGELGLFNSNSFGSASAIEDYVLWGANGIRDIVAQNAGIWTDNSFIPVAGMASGQSFQLGLGNPGNSAPEYFVGGASLGVAQSIPEPASLVFMVVTACGGFFFRRRLRR